MSAHDMGGMQSMQLGQGGRRMMDNVNDKLVKYLENRLLSVTKLNKCKEFLAKYLLITDTHDL